LELVLYEAQPDPIDTTIESATNFKILPFIIYP
jgi:hypothetical protein